MAKKKFLEADTKIKRSQTYTPTHTQSNCELFLTTQEHWNTLNVSVLDWWEIVNHRQTRNLDHETLAHTTRARESERVRIIGRDENNLIFVLGFCLSRAPSIDVLKWIAAVHVGVCEPNSNDKTIFLVCPHKFEIDSSSWCDEEILLNYSVIFVIFWTKLWSNISSFGQKKNHFCRI